MDGGGTLEPYLFARLDLARDARNGAWLGGNAGLVAEGMYYVGLSNATGGDPWFLLVVGPGAGAAISGIVGLIIEELTGRRGGRPLQVCDSARHQLGRPR
jgi:hypothetical protein